jgi:chromate transporter
MKKPSLYELIKTAFYIGAVGYGGPAILALMKKIFVHEKKWISEKEFMNSLSLAQVLPGATGVNIMGYIGFKLYKLWGGILAPVLFILPATILMTILAWAYFKFGNLAFIQSLFAGLGALVVALLLNATSILSKSVFKKITYQDWKGLLISLVTFAGIFFLKLNAIWLILLSGSFGFIFFYFTHEFEDVSAKGGEVLLVQPGTLKRATLSVKDFTPIFIVLLIFLSGLIVPGLRNIISSFVGIGSFSFGGGFAAIPLIQHQVVDVHSWLSVKDFIAGIALGQVTPGPVFITATFIGYHVAGLAGAVFATLAIFTPSLVAMLFLADIHGRIQNLKIVKVIIKGILSGFIGLLLAISLQFALNSLFNWQTWIIFLMAVGWLMILKKNSLWAILGTIVLSLLIF